MNSEREAMANHDDIERRAYELYETRGREDGRDLDDWLNAERQLRGDDDHSMRGASARNNATNAPGRTRIRTGNHDTASTST